MMEKNRKKMQKKKQNKAIKLKKKIKMLNLILKKNPKKWRHLMEIWSLN